MPNHTKRRGIELRANRFRRGAGAVVLELLGADGASLGLPRWFDFEVTADGLLDVRIAEDADTTAEVLEPLSSITLKTNPDAAPRRYVGGKIVRPLDPSERVWVLKGLDYEETL